MGNIFTQPVTWDDPRYNIDDEKIVELIHKFSKSHENQAYIPEVRKLETTETGLEEKFGGRLPFLTKSESWPMNNNGQPLRFIFQFCDPKTNDNILHRFFLTLYEYGPSFDKTPDEAQLLSIKLTDNVILQQNKNIKPPPDTVVYDPYEITEWDIKTELASYSTLYKITEIQNYMKKNYNNKHGREITFLHNFEKYMKDNPQYEELNCIKIWGTPRSTQLEDYVQHLNFVQLTETQYLPITWGDAGIGHIGKDGELYWDCC